MKHTLYMCASLVALLASSPALADGLPYQPTVNAKAPTSNAVHCYGGGFVSGAFNQSDLTVPAAGVNMNLGEISPGGGPEIGCDLYMGAFVIGVLGDYTFQSGKTTNTMLGMTGSAPLPNEGDLLVRFGFSPTVNTLVYGVAGVGLAEKSKMTMTPIAVSMPFNGGEALVLGGGMEFAIAQPLSLFIEFRHEDFGSTNGTIAAIPTSVSNIEDSVKVGVRFRLY